MLPQSNAISARISLISLACHLGGGRSFAVIAARFNKGSLRRLHANVGCEWKIEKRIVLCTRAIRSQSTEASWIKVNADERHTEDSP